MKIAIACDHAGFHLKEEVKILLQNQGHQILDFGCDSQVSCDLPDYIYPAALAVAKGKAERGVFIDGVGYGSAIIANKISGLYAAVCQDPFCAQLARSHSNTNILCIGAKIIGSGIASEIVNVWMATDFLYDQEKYKKRVERVIEISEQHLQPLLNIDIENNIARFS
jgi:ribose 5-phosphate isomerase B